MDWQRLYAKRMDLLAPSVAVAEILKLAESPEVISFAGGLPDPRSFCLERIGECLERVLREDGSAALNYGPNPGYSKLRDWIVERMAVREKVNLRRENILITSGGLEALNLISMALVDPGGVVLVEAPTYLVALHVLRACQARIEPVACDGEGLDPSALEQRVRKIERRGERARFLYLIPSFQNPSGLTLSEERRKRLVAISERYRLPIVEDHAYAELRYEGPELPSLKSLAPAIVVFIHTFSKIFGPGVRLGWVAADADLVTRLGLCKLGTDQCANSLTQRLVYDYGSRGWIEEQVRDSIRLYRRKRDLLLEALGRWMPGGVSWTRPEGGFFVWLRLGPGADSEALLRYALEREKIAFVAGPPFFADGTGAGYLRLSFSFIAEDAIEEGVRRLARVLGHDRAPAA